MSTLSAMTVVSVFLTLLPVMLVFVMRSTAERPIWEVALDIPFALAVDLLTILLLTLVVRLEVSILVSRAVWSLACVAYLVRRRSNGARWAWPRALGLREVGAVLLASACAVVVCMEISRPYRIGDHNWHDGLVPLLATQKLPFTNVFEPRQALHYHFIGDVFAAEIRTLSGNVMSAALALALVHDITFGLLAATTSLLMLGLGQRNYWVVALGGLAFTLHGPIALHGNGAPAFHGYSYWSYLVASCRPHMSVAGVLTCGFVGAVVVGLTQPNARKATTATLIVTTAVLGITDEAAIGPLGVGLGVAWLLRPGILASSRRRGLIVLATLLGVIVATTLAFGGALAGDQVSKVEWVAARVPALFGQPVLPLTAEGARTALFFEVLPFTMCLVGLGVLTWRARSVELGALFLFSIVVVVLSMALALRIEVNGTPSENQRFFVAPFFVTILPCLWLYHRSPRASLATVAMLLGAVLPAVFTLHWLRAQARGDLGIEVSVGNAAIPQNLYEVECRNSTGARFGERAELRYIETTEYFFYFSCRPVFAAGEARPPWTVKVAPVHETFWQLWQLDAQYLDRGEVLQAICHSDPAQPSDAVCARALQNRSQCVPEGTMFLRCPLTAEDRRALLE